MRTAAGSKLLTDREEREEAARRQQLSELGQRIAAEREKKPEVSEAELADDAPSGSRVGYELLGAVLACTGLGYLIDQQIGSVPIGTLAGLFLGFVAGVANAWRATNGIDRAVGLRQPPVMDQTKDKTEL